MTQIPVTLMLNVMARLQSCQISPGNISRLQPLRRQGLKALIDWPSVLRHGSSHALTIDGTSMALRHEALASSTFFCRSSRAP